MIIAGGGRFRFGVDGFEAHNSQEASNAFNVNGFIQCTLQPDSKSPYAPSRFVEIFFVIIRMIFIFSSDSIAGE